MDVTQRNPDSGFIIIIIIISGVYFIIEVQPKEELHLSLHSSILDF
jgi:hypothetical protein